MPVFFMFLDYFLYAKETLRKEVIVRSMKKVDTLTLWTASKILLRL